jgi:filamentous hemagglutinin
MLAAKTAVGIGLGGAQGAAAAFNADANNRQLHPDDYKVARDNAKLVAKKLGITEDEAEGRIVRQLQRNVDGATAQQDAGKRDEPIISILGCGLLKCDAKSSDPNYWNPAYNAEYIKPNQSSYDKGVAQSNAGLTPQQMEERNNRAGAPIAKAGAVILGGYILAPTVAVIGTELIAFGRNPVVYCTANPTACIGAVDVAAGTAAGVPLTGVPVPHAVPNAGTVGVKVGTASSGAVKVIDGAVPNAENAFIDPTKIVGYALNPSHPVGSNKAVVFDSALGYNQSNADQLMAKIQQGIRTTPAVLGDSTKYGQLFIVDMPITGPNGNTAVVRTGWILEKDSTVPRLTTAYVR